MAKVTELELKGIIHSEINNAIGFMGSNLSAQRRKSLEYYMGDKLGTEIDGRSQVVSTDVADTVESMLPNLLRIFTASDKVVTCEMKAGSVLFLHQLVPHRSLENYSDDVRWSVDLRFQNPNDEAGFHTGLIEPIIMRKSEDSNYQPDWDLWVQGHAAAQKNFRDTRAENKDEFDSTMEGAWLTRWDK